MGICGYDEKWIGKNIKGQTVGALGSKINSCAHAINCCILKGERNVENIVKECIDQGYTNFQKDGPYTKDAKTPIEGMANKVLGHIDWINKQNSSRPDNFFLQLQKIHDPVTVECLLNAVCAETKGMIEKGGTNVGGRKIIGGYFPVRIDAEQAYKALAQPGEEVDIDCLLDQIEKDCRAKGLVLHPRWREITEKNILEGWLEK